MSKRIEGVEMKMAGIGAVRQLAILNGKAPNSPEINRVRESLASRRAVAHSFYEARRSKKLTQADVATLAGIKQACISEIESLRGNPTLDTLDRVGKVLGLQLTFGKREPDDADSA